MSESDLISENPNLCTCSDGDPSTPHERGCPSYVPYDTFSKPPKCPSNGCPLGANHPGPCAYPDELAKVLTPPCTCDVTGEQPHAEDCPRAKRMNLTEGLPGQIPDVDRERAEWFDKDGPITRPRSAVEIAMERVDLPDHMMPMPEGAVIGENRMVTTPTRINEDGNTVPDLRSPREVAIGSNPFVQKREALQREMVSSQYTMRRRGRMIPERGRMVVARVEWDEKIGSIFILDGHKKQLEQSNQEAVIMACGPLRIDPATGKEIPMRFSIQEAIGKHIVIREHSGIEFVTHDENGKEIICYWIGQSEIWGWLEPYPGDEANSPEIWKAIAYLGEETAAPVVGTCRTLTGFSSQSEPKLCGNPLPCPAHPFGDRT